MFQTICIAMRCPCQNLKSTTGYTFRIHCGMGDGYCAIFVLFEFHTFHEFSFAPRPDSIDHINIKY